MRRSNGGLFAVYMCELRVAVVICSGSGYVASVCEDKWGLSMLLGEEPLFKVGDEDNEAVSPTCSGSRAEVTSSRESSPLLGSSFSVPKRFDRMFLAMWFWEKFLDVGSFAKGCMYSSTTCLTAVVISSLDV